MDCVSGEPGKSREDKVMKRRLFGRGWLLCAVLASLTAVLASCAEGKEVRTLKKRESLSLTAEELLLSDRELFRIEKDGEGYLLFCDGEVSRLDAEFLASSWEENDGEPVQNEIFRWEREDGKAADCIHDVQRRGADICDATDQRVPVCS